MAEYENLSLKQLKTVAIQLARSLKNKGVVIGFVSSLGGGKTTFIKAFAHAFRIRRISSPTFVISHEYSIPQGKLYHLDFYRLTSLKQLRDLGFEEMAKNNNIVLIEWADRFRKITSQCDIIITLKVKPKNKRDVWIKIL